jgi:hypothetical protein
LLFCIGGACDQAICRLAKAWRKLLAHTDEELGMDTVFTRPGIVKLLENFQKNVSEIPDQNYYKFNFDGSFDNEDEGEEEDEDEAESADEMENDLDDDDDEDSSDYDSDEEGDWDDEYGEEDEDGMIIGDDDVEIPKELLQKALEAYNKITVNIPDDSDSD